MFDIHPTGDHSFVCGQHSLFPQNTESVFAFFAFDHVDRVRCLEMCHGFTLFVFPVTKLLNCCTCTILVWCFSTGVYGDMYCTMCLLALRIDTAG